MTDKRFWKILIYATINTFIMSLFIYTTQYQTMLYLMVSVIVFNIFVAKDKEKAPTD